MTVVQTTFVGVCNPFTDRLLPGFKSDKRKPKRVPNKHLSEIATLRYGHCIICQPGEVRAVRREMLKFLCVNVKAGRVQTMERWPVDGLGRVWLRKLA